VLSGKADGLKELFEAIVREVPAPKADPTGPLQFLVHNTEHDEYVGRLAIGRIHRGTIKPAMQVLLHQEEVKDHPKSVQQKLGVLFAFENLGRVKVESASAGDIVAVSGMDDVQIGDTVTAIDAPHVLPRIVVEEPTIKVQFQVSDSPFAGKKSKWITSRHLRDRLYREAKHNIALKVEDTANPDTFTVFGRGELMLAILAETMRREGYEFCVGMPQVVERDVDGVTCEPIERVVVDVPEEFVGMITTRLGERRGKMEKMNTLGHGRTRLEFVVPSRGLIGFRSMFLTETRGTGLLNTLFEGWEPQGEPMLRRRSGSIVADRKGTATPYALFHLQPRGILFIGPGTECYEGMIVGEHNRANDLEVNVVREKKLTNIRAAGKDENVILAPPRALSIELAMEYIDRDEIVEVAPDCVRIRKRVLDANDQEIAAHESLLVDIDKSSKGQTVWRVLASA
jgi:GTP-binding protein